MKKVILVLSLFSLFAQAEQRSIRDLSGIPNKGETWLQFELGFLKQEIDFTDTNGAFVSKSETSVRDFELSAVHGLTEKLSLSLTLEYALSSETDITSSTGSVSTFKADGIEDPTFSVSYRLLSESDKYANIDLLASISPKLQDSEGATTTEDGNAGKGRNDFSLSIEGSKTFDEKNQVNLLIGYLHQSDGSSQSAANSSLISTFERTELYTLLGTYQRKLNEKFDVSIGQAISHVSEGDSTSSGGVLTTVDSYFMYTTELGVNFSFREKYLFEAELSSSFRPDTDATSGGTALTAETETLAVALLRFTTVF